MFVEIVYNNTIQKQQQHQHRTVTYEGYLTRNLKDTAKKISGQSEWTMNDG
jgi:hypothetical protein